jgi:hypothetical protein
MPSSKTNFPAKDIYLPYFDAQIINLRRDIIYLKREVAGLVLAGVFIITLALLLSTRIPGLPSQLIEIGGIFIEALATFRYREFITIRSKINSYTLLKRGVEMLPKLSYEDSEDIRELALEAVKKNV